MIDDQTGFAPAQWQGKIGDAIVARKDKKNLSVSVHVRSNLLFPSCRVLDRKECIVRW